MVLISLIVTLLLVVVPHHNITSLFLEGGGGTVVRGAACIFCDAYDCCGVWLGLRLASGALLLLLLQKFASKGRNRLFNSSIIWILMVVTININVIYGQTLPVRRLETDAAKAVVK